MTSRSVQLVQKEQIKFLKFPKEDVLEQKEDQEIRLSELKRIVSSNDFEKERRKIFFADDSSLKKIETTISAVTEKSVILKHSTMIPLKRVISVT